ncbi:MAG TPA: nucleotidyltransferase domain-containing protein [Candidatus Mediterraneibacter colneyensis]|nr:nucleotidyltransferase domain-containing protein [Candidatus Mediterraneibacter colneyensis]
MTAETVLKAVRELCEKYKASEIILYGSRAKGTALERSDIDIAVSGVKNFDALAEAVEQIPTLYTVDLLDLDSCRNELLLEDIRKYGRKI